MQAQWQRVGVALELRPQEYATFYSDVVTAAFRFTALRWVGGNNDPDIFEFVFSSKKFRPTGTIAGAIAIRNWTRFSIASRVEADREKRRALLADDPAHRRRTICPTLISGTQTTFACIATRCDATAIAPSGDYSFLETLEFRDHP